jgi:protein-S-isoprenylcysteine O-methyltransferase Ste14
VNQAVLVEHIRQSADLVWVVLVVVWIVFAWRTKRTIRRESNVSQLLYTFILAIGVYLIFGPNIGIRLLDQPLYPLTPSVAVAGFAAVLLGVGISIWARVILADNWSNSVTLKENHTLVIVGPYRAVRHPIYSGNLLAMVGSAMQRGEVRSFLGVALLFLSFWLKARVEERFMMQEFGDDYLKYCREVRALVPMIF